MKRYAAAVTRQVATGAISVTKLAVYLALGFALGLAGGHILMGTAHAVLETRGKQHYVKAEAAGDVVAKSSVGRTLADGGGSAGGNTIHTLCTSNGSPYQNYQMRIAYATYKLVLGMPGGGRHVGFTRILHRTVDDELVVEVPTFRADPLQPNCDGWCEYPVSDRANAVRQFFAAAAAGPGLIKGDWIYMIESDYVFMKPLELPPAGAGAGQAWAFPFGYIQPAAHREGMRKLYPGDAADIPASGPAPVLMQRSDWEKVTPDWERLTAVIEGDEAMKKELGWVREMYAFSAALALSDIKVDLTPPPDSRFISQLPGDVKLGKAHAFHYTLCTIYKTMNGSDVWGYDKRFFTTPEVAQRVPLVEMPPPFEEGKYKFVEGPPVTRAVHDTIVQMVTQMNRGIETLAELPGAGATL